MHDTYAYWSAFGQCVILALIQIGGLGLVTLTTFFNIAIGRKLGLRGMHLAQESVASTGPDINQLMKVVMITALTVETAGALLLATVFVPEFGAEGIFISVFTSVSAFCNAGFDIFGRAEPYVSLTGYVGNPIVVGTVGLLIIVGGIGFIVIHDLLQYRRTKSCCFTPASSSSPPFPSSWWGWRLPPSASGTTPSPWEDFPERGSGSARRGSTR